jgi:hypothetical protein
MVWVRLPHHGSKPVGWRLRLSDVPVSALGTRALPEGSIQVRLALCAGVGEVVLFR